MGSLLLNRRSQRLLWSGLAFLAIGCAPTMKPGPADGEARISFVINKDKIRRDGSLNANGGSVTLPDDYCYAVHMTGDGLEKVNPGDNVCGPAAGLGLMTPQAYNRGDTAEIDAKVGTRRRFELIGFASPLGTENGRAKCGTLTAELVKGSSALTTYLKLSINGVEVNSKPILFATGSADINPGDNLVTLEAVPKVSSSLTTQLAFGAPYARGDGPNAPADCVAPRRVLPPNEVYVNSAVSISQPQQSSSSVRKLQFITSRPEIFSRPNQGSATRNVAGTRDLATGLAEIVDRRNSVQ